MWGLLSFSLAAQPVVLATHYFPPYSFEQDHQVKGIAVDLVQEAMRRLKIPVTIKIYPWARALEETKIGNTDGIFSAFKTPDRELYLSYGKETLIPYVMVLVARSDSPFKNAQLSELSQAAVGRVNQQSYGPAFDQAVKQGRFKAVDTANSNELLAKMLLAKRFDMMVTDRYVGQALFKNLGYQDLVRELEPPVSSLPSYLAFTKAQDRSQLRDQFDRALKAMRADGTTAKIYQSYGYLFQP